LAKASSSESPPSFNASSGGDLNSSKLLSLSLSIS